MNTSPDFLFGLIVGCEIAFWVVLFLGLVARYLFKWHRLGAMLLAIVPLIDLILLAATTIDLRNGANASFAHGVAAAYIGFSVAFGPATIRWADDWFAHRFGGAERQLKQSAYGWANVLYELKWWGRCVFAAGVVCALVGTAILLVDDPTRTDELSLWFRVSIGTVAVWFVLGPLWSVIFFKRAPVQSR